MVYTCIVSRYILFYQKQVPVSCVEYYNEKQKLSHLSSTILFNNVLISSKNILKDNTRWFFKGTGYEYDGNEHRFHWYEYNSHFPTLIIFKMDDDGSALRVRAKYKSFTDLECAVKTFLQDNYVQLYKRTCISRKLGTGSKYKNMEVADLLIYKELDYSCIHGGTNFSSISSSQRPNTR